MKTNKMFVLLGFLVFTSLAASAAMRYRWQTPVNQMGGADSFALPCEVVTLSTKTATALGVWGVTKSTALAEAGAVYWLNIDPAATAGDYIVLRDSATANYTSTPLIKLANSATTASTLIRFDPPIYVSNGLSIDASTAATGASVCVREADGGI